MSRVLAITGAGGFLGRCITARAAGRAGLDKVLALDIRPDPHAAPPVHAMACDVTAPFDELFKTHGVTDAVHLAFQVDPRHDLAQMRRVNVDGCAHFLQACAAADVRRALVVSSATAYGARPDNPRRLKEGDPLRAHSQFPYARHKAEAEQLCARFTRAHPRTRLAVVRPCVVVGPHMHNYLSRMMQGPVVFGPWGQDPPMQFIHEDDLARAVVDLLAQGAHGAFNLAPEDTVRFSELVRMTGRPRVRVPAPLLKLLTSVAWKLRLRGLTEVPPGFIDYIRYSWCVDNTRLTREHGFAFRYSTRQALAAWLETMSEEKKDRHVRNRETEEAIA